MEEDEISLTDDTEVSGTSDPKESAVAQELAIDEDATKDDALVSGIIPTSVHSWTYYALAVVVGLIIIDRSISSIGSEFFWSQRLTFISSVVIRTAVLICVTMFFKKIVFPSKQAAYVVTVGIGFLSGLILALLRFLIDSSFWTFLNLIAEPIDFSVIGLAAGYIAYNLLGTFNPLTKKNL